MIRESNRAGWLQARPWVARLLIPISRGRWFLVAMVVAFGLATPARAAGPVVTDSILSDGARLLVSEQHALPIVDVRIRIDAGARLDPAGRTGTANLVAELLSEGTRTRSASEISETIDALGASLDTTAGMDYAELSLRVLRRDLVTGLDLLADVLEHPAFAQAELERRRESVLASIRAERDDPTRVAQKVFRRAVYKGESYDHPVEGLEADVPHITRAHLREFYRAYYRPARTLVVVVGDIDAQEARSAMERVLAAWTARPVLPTPYRRHAASGAQHLRVSREVTQAAIILGHRGIARANPDYEAIRVMNYILGGGGFSSRLMDRIRVREGLAYSVGSFFATGRFSGTFQIVMQTKNSSVPRAILLAREGMERIRETPVTAKELDEAKKYLTGSFPLRLDSNREIAQFVADIAFYSLGMDYADRFVERIRAVTREDVQRVAKRYLRPRELIEVVVGAPEKADG